MNLFKEEQRDWTRSITKSSAGISISTWRRLAIQEDQKEVVAEQQ